MGGSGINFTPWADFSSGSPRLARGSDMARHFVDPLGTTGNPQTQRVAENKKNDIEAANAKAISDAKSATDLAASQASASITQKKRAIARSKSVYTSPLGASDQASTARKTLLGQ